VQSTRSSSAGLIDSKAFKGKGTIVIKAFEGVFGVHTGGPAPRVRENNSIPASFFSIPLGLIALGIAWQTAASLWSVSNWIAEALVWGGTGLWSFLLIAYLGKWLFRRADAMAELQHPIQSCFIGLAGVVSLLASIGLSMVYRPLRLGFFYFGIVWTLIFALYQTGRLWMGDSKPETLTPILYLPIAAGAFVAASACAAMGYGDWGKLAFGGGLFTWFAIESVILYRLYTVAPILPALRPAMGVQLAPPAVGAVAYLSVGGGTPDIFANALIGYALLQALILIRLLPWLLQADPTPAWWSFSFAAASLPNAAMKLAAHRDAGAISAIAPYLFVAGNLVIAAIAAVTIKWAIKTAWKSGRASETGFR
jgi:tellurite resistance protein